MTILAVVVLFWESLNLKLAWAKGAMGKSVDWIGASLTVVKVAKEHPAGMRMAISETHCAKVYEIAIRMAAGARISRKELREFAGLVAWIANVMPCVGPFPNDLGSVFCSAGRYREAAVDSHKAGRPTASVAEGLRQGALPPNGACVVGS